MRKTLSVCMIVRDEEMDIGRCLESIADISDEIIVVDTGSIDKTKEIAKDFGAKIYEFQWVDDFSKARNYSIKKANCDWILILDGDDEFERQDANRLKELINKKDAADVYIFNTICYTGDKGRPERILNVNIRLFKNNLGLRYQGRIHESLIAKNSDIKMEAMDISIYHYGYLNANVKKHGKRKRNMRILNEQLKEEPDNPYFLFCMGNEYFALGLPNKALEYFNASFEKCNETDIYVPKLLIRIIMVYQIERNYEKAISYIDKTLLLYPQYTDVEYIRGTIYHSQGILTKAIRSFRKCIEMGEPPAVLNFIMGVGSYKSYFALGCIYNQLEDYGEALGYFNQALLTKPDFYDAIYSIGEVLERTTKSEKEYKDKLLQFFDINSSNSYGMIADIFYLQRKHNFALEFIEKSKTRGIYNEGLELLEAQCYFYLQRYDEAIEVLRSFNNKSKYYNSSIIIHCLSLLFKNEHAKAMKIIKPLEYRKGYELKYRVLAYLISIFAGEDKGKPKEKVELMANADRFIFELLDMMLGAKEFDKFEKTLVLLNSIKRDDVLLTLSKLYNKYGYIDLAIKEIIRSIKLFDKVDKESAYILYKGSL